ncbi:hypothetical protein CBS63078_1701 [Aspergillus niger]|nr:hypothetical protein CBS133816_9669 [Aspergillus niger]KAI2823205.1 hypothetical protein CBS115989_1583 [Aspergillus niger]KAI2846277.1 hypothetical protein CBS11350_3817 [Aspergillus niger]KAI2855754.1 hypothetical protein CBS11232_4223 [Aspergillus niger]KAI2867326.1 hypothetical protein CBS12448_291 [Aspergillus niger]
MATSINRPGPRQFADSEWRCLDGVLRLTAETDRPFVRWTFADRYPVQRMISIRLRNYSTGTSKFWTLSVTVAERHEF